MIHIIYLTTCLINGVQYVGRHKVSNPVTLDPNYIGSGTLFKRAVKKCGKENFKRKISKSMIGHKVSSETKKKLSESHIGKDSPMKGKKLSLETKKRISDNHADFSGSKNPMYGSTFIWINNGVINKRHSINTPIPNDWNKGMIYKSK